MAKIRTIKPGFFTSEDVSALPLRARLTWIGLWTHCDDYGRAKDNVKLIKAAIWPLDDVSLKDIESDLALLHDAGRIVRYEVAGRAYLVVTAWPDHQRIARPAASKLPPPPGTVAAVSQQCHDTADAVQEGKGREGKGGANTRPHPTCTKHPNGTDEPCRACGQARRAHDAWKPAAQTYPTVGEVLAGATCDHGAPISPPCPLCRRGVAA